MLKGEYKNDFLGLEFEPLFPGESRTSFEGDTGEKKYEEPRQETFFQENAVSVCVIVNVFKGDICLSVHFHVTKA
ncbi:unnamed protein product, partial [Brassica napus]